MRPGTTVTTRIPSAATSVRRPWENPTEANLLAISLGRIFVRRKKVLVFNGGYHGAVFGFAGLSFASEGLSFDPVLPDSWQQLSFAMQWRGRKIHISIDAATGSLDATLREGAAMSLAVMFVCDLVLRQIRLAVRRNAGRRGRKMPQFGALQWIRYPRLTFRAASIALVMMLHALASSGHDCALRF